MPTSPARSLAPAADTELAARVDAAVGRALAEKRIVGAVTLVARDGEIVHAGAAGLADRESGTPMRVDTIFRLASITKPIVTAAAMRLVETGRLGLDDPVTRWLPDFRPRLADGSEPVILLRHLLTHTAGLSYGFFEPEGSAYHRLGISDGLDLPGFGLAENLRRLAQAPLATPPGAAWRYSLGLDVIGAVLEAAGDKSLPQLVAELVTGPLGLADSGFAVTDPARLAAAYADGAPEPARMADGVVVPLWDGAVRFAPGRAFDPTAYPSGGAGMVGSAGDILAFLETIRRGGGSILRSGTVAEMMRDQVGTQAETQGPGWGFGFGWAVLDDPAAAGTPQSKGTLQWGGAYGHSWFVDPARRLSVVALTNTAFEGMSGAYPGAIRDAVYG